jgi:hypothetical protein
LRLSVLPFHHTAIFVEKVKIDQDTTSNRRTS